MFYFCNLENRTKHRIYRGFNQDYTELSDKHNKFLKYYTFLTLQSA
nr:MAG TPA: hypothetical protein [Bacteriophage sp.]